MDHWNILNLGKFGRWNYLFDHQNILTATFQQIRNSSLDGGEDADDFYVHIDSVEVPPESTFVR